VVVLDSQKTGQCQSLDSTDIKFVSSLINQRHTIYLDEIQDELYQHRGICISVPILCTLQCLDLTYKVISAYALEQDDLIQLAFINHIDEVSDPQMIIFIVE
jgi:hypothetical protein